jgi:hypothetical protein
MDPPRRPGLPPSDDEGGDAWGPSLFYLAIAVLIVAGAIAFVLSPSPSQAPTGPRAAPPAALSAVAARPTDAVLRAAPQGPVRVAAAASAARPAMPHTEPAAPPPRSPRIREPDSDPTPDLSDYLNPGEVPTMAEVIQRLHAAGVHSGLGAFPPPGTRPPLIGLAVPEDFELPEGYVRHYQATDDGQRIEPILMFSPDHRLVDAANRPVAIPADRVVPPELAPPGLPMRQIAIPPPAEPGRPGR